MDDPQESEYTVISPNSSGKYVFTWDFTEEPENLVQIVVASEAVEASTWIFVANGSAQAETPIGS